MPHTTYAQKRIIKKSEISAKMAADNIGCPQRCPWKWRRWEEAGGGRTYPCTEVSLKKVHPVFTDGSPRTRPTPKHRRSPKGKRSFRDHKQSKRYIFANPFIKFIYNDTKHILVVRLGSEPFDATNSCGEMPIR